MNNNVKDLISEILHYASSAFVNKTRSFPRSFQQASQTALPISFIDSADKLTDLIFI